jgi:hypothetical protein
MYIPIYLGDVSLEQLIALPRNSHLPRSCMKYISATTAAPIPMPADVPMLTKARAARMPPQVGAAPDAAWAAIPMTETNTKMGRRPYTFASGDQIKGKTPAKTIGTVVWYEASTTLICIDLARGTNAEFWTWFRMERMSEIDTAYNNCLGEWTQEGQERDL